MEMGEAGRRWKEGVAVAVLGAMVAVLGVVVQGASELEGDLRAVGEFLGGVSGGRRWEFTGCELKEASGRALWAGSKAEVQCSNSSGVGGGMRVKALFLESLGLAGPYPEGTLGRLSALAECSLYNNSLSGPLPAELWRLPGLTYLSLSRNRFWGGIPAGASSAGGLSRLDLSYNRLVGAIPATLAESFPALRYLFLQANGLSAALPRSLPPSLLSLNLSSNSISQRLASLPRLPPSLSSLDLRLNSLHGDASAFLASLPPSLLFLDLSSNLLSGSLPRSSSSLTSSSLLHLGLAQNRFSPGPFPPWIQSFAHLQLLNLSRCRLTGPIPPGIARLTKLLELDLSFNDLNGSIPSSVAALRNLTYLDLSSNNLSGGASVLVSSTSLRYFNFSYNDGTGCVPPELRNKFGPESFEGLCEPFAAAVAQNQSRHSRSKMSGAIIVAVIVGTAVIVLGLLAAALACRGKAAFVANKVPAEERYVSGPFSFETESGLWLANVKDPTSVPVVIFEKPLSNLTFADLLQATSNFSKESQLTEGGFGPVYRAYLPCDLDVTIKVLIEGRILTDQEAAAEFGLLSKVKHPNLVPLLGYCVIGDERLVIYKYMENGGLHRWLHDLPVGTQLDDWSRDLQWEPAQTEVPASGELGVWARRHRIALGLARALAFLHHGHSPQIVHRDVKASNVVLDADFEPYLANTGLVGLLAAQRRGPVCREHARVCSS